MRTLVLANVACIACTQPPTQRPTQPPMHPQPTASVPSGYVLPAELSTERWFLDVKTTTGASLRIYLDSAGGIYLTKAAATRLGLAIEAQTDDHGTSEAVALPAFADPRIPAPVLPRMPVFEGHVMDGSDGMFGAPWFAGHAFSFDYPAHTLTLLDHGLPDVPPEHRIAVGFVRGDDGKVASPYGRIDMTVDGETIDMLLDTGATITLSEGARRALGGGPVERATSFITQTVFDRWHAKHPDWPVIEHADEVAGPSKAMPMIEVPSVIVGGYEVGPVWFTWRPDNAFHVWMAQWMDKPTEGALGGNAYRTLRVDVDWTAGIATFERRESPT
jgi:hypothetical protein